MASDRHMREVTQIQYIIFAGLNCAYHHNARISLSFELTKGDSTDYDKFSP